MSLNALRTLLGVSLMSSMLVQAAPPAIVETRFRRFDVNFGNGGGGDAMTLVTAIIDFDQPIYLKNMTSGTVLSIADVSKLNDPNMPPIVKFGAGITTLTCPNSNFQVKNSIPSFGGGGGDTSYQGSNPTYNGSYGGSYGGGSYNGSYGGGSYNGSFSNFGNFSIASNLASVAGGDDRPDFLLTCPSVDDPIAALVAMFQQGGIKFNEIIFPKRFAVAFPLPQGTEGPTSFDNCTLKIGSANDAPVELHNNVANQAGEVFTGTVKLPPPSEAICTYDGIMSVKNIIDQLFSYASTAATADIGNDVEGVIQSIQIREAFVGCQRDLKALSTFKNVTVHLESGTECRQQYGTPEFNNDPCCNYDLRRTMCCAPKAFDVQLQVVDSVSPAVNYMCRNPTAIKALVNSYAVYLQDAKALVPVDPSKRYQELFKFYQDCWAEVFSKSCTQDSDCKYTGKCMSSWGNRCFVEPGKEDAPLAKCYVEMMDPKLALKLAQTFRINPALNDTEKVLALRDQFSSRITINQSCIGPNAWQYQETIQWERNEDTNQFGPVIKPANLTGCTDEKQCNYGWNLDPNQCLAGDSNFCAECTGNQCWPHWASQKPKCYDTLVQWNSWSLSEYDRQALCQSRNATYVTSQYGGMGECLYNDRLTKDLCYNNPDSGCTSSVSKQDEWQKCANDYCYIRNITNDACWNMYQNQTLRDYVALPNRWVGFNPQPDGTCMVYGADTDKCSTLGWGVNRGVYFQEGLRWNQATCTGYCNVDYLMMRGDVTPQQCTATARCDQPCPMCRSNNGQKGEGKCFNATITSKDSCDTLSGFWDQNAGSTCTYQYNETACAAAGLTYALCESAKTRDGCLNYQYRDVLSCRWRPRDTCDTQQDCLTRGGECTDYEFQGQVDVWSNDSLVQGACVFAYNDSMSGCNGWITRDRSGCVDQSVTSPGQCQQNGGNWQNKAFSEAACNAHGYGCQEQYFYDLTPKTPQACTACGGKVVPKYTWNRGRWVGGDWVPLTWKTKAYTSVNQVAPGISNARLQLLLQDAVGKVVGEEILNYHRQGLNRLKDLLATVACDCGPDSGYRSCFNLNNTTPLGSCATIPGQASACAGSKVTVGADSFLNASTVVTVDVDLAPAYQAIASTNGYARRRLARRSGPNSYSVVQCSGSTCGQILGDGVSFSASSTLTGSVQVCAPVDPAVSQSSYFTINDIGKASNGVISPLYTSVNISGSNYCFNANSTGLFYAVIRAPAGVVVPDATSTSTASTATATTTSGSGTGTGASTTTSSHTGTSTATATASSAAGENQVESLFALALGGLAYLFL